MIAVIFVFEEGHKQVKTSQGLVVHVLLNSLASFACSGPSIEGDFGTTFLTCSQGVREISNCCGQPAGDLAHAGVSYIFNFSMGNCSSSCLFYLFSV